MNEARVDRKIKSMNILKEHNVYCFAELPCIETSDEVLIRTKEEIARRAIACFFTIQLACDIAGEIENIEESKNIFERLIKEYGVEEYLTYDEKDLFTLNVIRQDAINIVWKYEGVWVLMWALGFIDELNFPSEICDTRFLIDVIQKFNNVDEIIESSVLRDIDVILDEADLIFRYDWNCVDARLKNKIPDSGLDTGVVLERHRALNWLIDCDGENDWDNVSTNT